MSFNEAATLRERHTHVEAMRAIVDKVEAEKRGLSRSENSKMGTHEAKIAECDAMIEAHRSGKLDVYGNLSDGSETIASKLYGSRSKQRNDDDSAIGLRRGQSMQTWAERRGAFYGVAGDGIDTDDASGMSLGSIVRAMVTGRRDGMSDSERRALSEGTDSAGGYLTPEILAARLIDRVRNTGRIFQAGATVVPLESDTVSLARLVSGVTPAWKAEGDAVSVSDMTFDRLTFKPKTLPVLVKLSQELFDDLSPQGYSLIENEIAKAIALEVDRAALYGDGTGATPTGIKSQSGVTLTAFGGANGGTPSSFDFLLDGIQTLAGSNFAADGFLLAPRTERTLNGLKDTTGRYLEAPQSVKDVPTFSTNQIPTNLTVGTSTGVCSDVFVGDWSNLLVGFRPSMQLRIKTLQERFADTMQVGLLVWIRADVQLAHAAAFNVISGVKS